VRIEKLQGATTDMTSTRIKEIETEYKVKRQNIAIDSDGVGG
jgi:hypothetical protein